MTTAEGRTEALYRWLMYAVVFCLVGLVATLGVRAASDGVSLHLLKTSADGPPIAAVVMGNLLTWGVYRRTPRPRPGLRLMARLMLGHAALTPLALLATGVGPAPSAVNVLGYVCGIPALILTWMIARHEDRTGLAALALTDRPI